MANSRQITCAIACLADAERDENCLGTRVDAAIQAIVFIDKAALTDPAIQRYIAQKYVRPMPDSELVLHYQNALAIAKQLLSSKELA